MSIPRFGASFGAGNAKTVLELILKAESLGVKGVWFTAGAGGGDTLTVCAAAALGTTSINIGTAIVPTFPRHPVVMAQQTATVAQLAPGRFNLGIGPSHAPTMESLGVPYKQPIGHLREYLTIVQSLLKTGTVDFKGGISRCGHACPPRLTRLSLSQRSERPPLSWRESWRTEQ